MSKGLEALENLYCAGRLDLDYVINGKQKEDYNIIEKELKALEIIKEKNVDIDWYCGLAGFTPHNDVLTDEEYELLKEVFKC